MTDSQRDEITKLETLYASNPEGRVFTHLAEAYRKAGELDRARDILDQGLRRHPDYASAHVVLGRVHADQGNPAEAAAAFTRVLQLDPENLIARRSLAESDRAAGRHGEALKHYRELLTHDPGDEEMQAIVAELEASTAPPAPQRPEAEPTTHAEEQWDSPSNFSNEPIDMGSFGGGALAADEPLSLDAISFQGDAPEEADSTFNLDAGNFGFDTFDREQEAEEPETAADLSLSDLGFESETAPEAEPVDDFGLEAEAAGEAESIEDLASMQPPEPDLDELAAFAESAPPSEDMPAWAALGAWGVAADAADAVDDADAADDARGGMDSDDEPWSAAADAPPAPVEPSMATETLAELYRGQGFADRAADVYRELVRQRPDDATLQARLHETEAEAQALRADRIGVEETREFWVSGSTADAASAGHAWGEPDDDEADEGTSIGQYFSGILAWRPSVPARRPMEMQPPDGLVAAGDMNAAPMRPPSSAPFQDEASMAVPESAVDVEEPLARVEDPVIELEEPMARVEDPSADLADVITTQEGGVSDAYLAEMLTAEPVADEPGDAAADLEPPVAEEAAELFLTEPAADHADELFLTDAIGEEAVAAVEEPAAPGEPEPVSMGWDPTVELAGEAGADGGADASSQAGTTPAGGPAAPEEEPDDEDDDLEMFRSWLQSLKK